MTTGDGQLTTDSLRCCHGQRKPRDGLAPVYGDRRPELSYGNQGGRRPAENRGQEVLPPAAEAHAAQGEEEVVIGHWSFVLGHLSLATAAVPKDQGQMTKDK